MGCYRYHVVLHYHAQHKDERDTYSQCTNTTEFTINTSNIDNEFKYYDDRNVDINCYMVIRDAIKGQHVHQSFETSFDFQYMTEVWL